MNAVREYAFPVVLALLLHGVVAVALVRGWQAAPDDMPRLAEPRIIEASILVMEKPATRAPLPSARPVPPAPRPEPPPPKAPEVVPKPDPKPKPPPPDPESERRAEAEAARAQRLRDLAEQSTALALEIETTDLSALMDATADQATMTYAAAIKQAVMMQWSRPPSARLGMTARFQIDLVPSGEILAVQLLDGSGNAAFDRSAQAAIRKASPFQVPAQNALFEEHFRRFTLLFDPQDLLR